jgi:hypothetical protein
LKYQLKGDKAGAGYALYLTDASGETHKFPTGKKIDWDDWREISVDVAASHETWGGDKNGKIDYPLQKLTFEIGTPGAIDSHLFFKDIKVDTNLTPAEINGVEIKILSPKYNAEIDGAVPVKISAPGLTAVVAKIWQNDGTRFGKKITLAKIKLDADGAGEFTFDAPTYPRGPITLTLYGKLDTDADAAEIAEDAAETLTAANKSTRQDWCYLQLYNRAGKNWDVGIPKKNPPAAEQAGLTLKFSDDFTGPLSIGDGEEFKYYDHKPNGGQTDFSDWGKAPFVSFAKPNNPFAQVDSYLRIRCDVNQKSTGLISSMGNNGRVGGGIKLAAPCYFEARFIGPNAIGSWPGWWLMTDHHSPESLAKHKGASDELDIIEAYGGNGPTHPNSFDAYQITPHAWAQSKEIEKLAHQYSADLKNPARMHRKGIPSTWYDTFHTYGCLVTTTDTIYYCDDIEMGRHPTLPLSQEVPIFFMLNLAVGGGWPIDLTRYDNVIDMYVDWIRVYGK